MSDKPEPKCVAVIWPAGGKRPRGHRPGWETIEPEPQPLCGTHANSWSSKGYAVRERKP